MAKAVASATAALVMAAKEVSDTCEDKTDQNRLIESARHCGLATSQLVACTKVLAPTVSSSPECQEQFGEAAKQVASFVDDVIETAEVTALLYLSKGKGKSEVHLYSAAYAASVTLCITDRAIVQLRLHLNPMLSYLVRM